MGKIRLKKQKRQIDKKLFFYAFILTTLGLIAVADTSAPVALSVFSDKFYFLKQQVVWGAIGLGALLFVSKVHYSFWQKIALPLFIVNILNHFLDMFYYRWFKLSHQYRNPQVQSRDST